MIEEVIMVNRQINPRLIQALTGKSLDSISATPTNKDLGGKYVKKIIDHRLKIESIHPKHCKKCGKNGKYDIGLVCINIPETEKDKKMPFQMTGYFRCKHCNAAEWEASPEFYFLAMAAIVSPHLMGEHFIVARNELFDGSIHQYITDAEEHLLNIMNILMMVIFGIALAIFIYLDQDLN